jgi:2-oxoglutarate dehydrogenase E1 component
VDGSGDVKYHLGASSDRVFDDNTVHLSLTANPSHLEAVNPVVLGKVRAKQDQMGDAERKKVVGVLLHGDAAFAGQGVVAEGLGLSGLRGHRTGGTIHFIVNNQIGFTTAPHFSRSSPYPTDIALMVEAPIFHVNGDDPEAVVHAAKVAIEFRQMFGKDVVIDIFCYRRFGHNEGDEPMFTNPVMYKKIKTQKTTLQLYTERLVKDGLIPEGEIEDMKAAFQAQLNEEFEAGKEYKPNKADWLDGRWSHLDREGEEYQRGETAIKPETLAEIGRALTTVPDGFNIHKTIARQLEAKKAMFETGHGFDWATAEAVAFGSILTEGYPVRLSGQDSTRGTFSQRHSALVDQATEDRYYPLNHIREGQPVTRSSTRCCRNMPCWVRIRLLAGRAKRAGDVGGAVRRFRQRRADHVRPVHLFGRTQMAADVGSRHAPAAWVRGAGAGTFLGPAGTLPADVRRGQLDRGQLHDARQLLPHPAPAAAPRFRKPLVLMTPKSLLRHRLAVSDAADFTTGSSFHRVLWDDAEKGHSDTTLVADDKIRRVVISSGKVYFDLLEERDARGIDDVYLLRLEQFYPFPALALMKELERFKGAEIVWCQEEPKNQGAWSFVEPNLEWVLTRIGAAHTRPRYVGRPASASPATGLASQHKAQQSALVNDALTIEG